MRFSSRSSANRMSYDSVFSRWVSRSFLVCFSTALLLIQPAILRAAEGGAGLSATGKVDDAISPETRTYLQLQEQLHATQLAVDRNRKESTETAIQTAEVVASGMKATTELSGRMKALEETLNNQKSGEWQAMQSSNRTMLIVAGVFASFGFMALLMLGYFQWRTINRLAEISAVLPNQPGLALGLYRTRAALTAGDSIASTPSPQPSADSDLLKTLARLEKRIKELEMEQGVPSAVESVENPDVELLDDQNPNGNSNGAHIMANGNSAPEPIVTTRSPESEQAAILLTKGQSLLDVEKVEEALECFEQALALEPKNPEALVKKGAALEKMRKLIEAIECYDLAIAADSTMTIAYLYKGGLCNRLERFNEALQCYEQALRTQEKRAA
jgi:tetratricopeptide (TPR) repeat protein